MIRSRHYTRPPILRRIVRKIGSFLLEYPWLGAVLFVAGFFLAGALAEGLCTFFNVEYDPRIGAP